MKCKITRQKSGVEYYQYECKTHNLRWLGGNDSRKPKFCFIAAQQSGAVDASPREAQSDKLSGSRN